MPVIQAIVPALRALARRDVRAGIARDPSSVKRLRRSAEFADLTEALHHLGQLALELQREDGTLVPTTEIAIQDCDALRELASHGADAHSFPWDDDITEMLFDDAGEVEDDVGAVLPEDLRDVLGPTHDELNAQPWLPDDVAESPPSRYQVFVMLVHDGDIP